MGMRIRAMSRGQGSLSSGCHKQSGLTTPSKFRPHWPVKNGGWAFGLKHQVKIFLPKNNHPIKLDDNPTSLCLYKICLKCPTASEQLWVFSHCQTFPLTSAITDVNLECGTPPGWRNSERELLTFVQSHDRREGPEQPQENKLYLQWKKNFSLCFSFCINLHQANIKANPTHSWKYPTKSHFLESHLKNNNSKKVWLSSTPLKNTPMVRRCQAEDLQIVSISPLDSLLGQCSSLTATLGGNQLQNKKNHRAADSPPGVVVVWKLEWFGVGKKCQYYWIYF